MYSMFVLFLFCMCRFHRKIAAKLASGVSREPLYVRLYKHVRQLKELLTRYICYKPFVSNLEKSFFFSLSPLFSYYGDVMFVCAILRKANSVFVNKVDKISVLKVQFNKIEMYVCNFILTAFQSKYFIYSK